MADKTISVKAFHPQVTVTVGDMSAEVDVELAPLITEIWRAGWSTWLSCQEHSMTGKAWIAFDFVDEAEAFLNAVAQHNRRAGALWCRANDWYFGQFGSTSGHIARHGPRHGHGDWEYHVAITDDAFNEATKRWRQRGQPDFRFSVSVLFPRSDIPEVTAMLVKHNAREQ
jgi:hypothetical protein